MPADAHPQTPDGRYFVVRGRLWRRSNPALGEAQRTALVKELMRARRAVGVALRGGDERALAEARTAVDRSKVALGERGAPWWDDGAPDFNRRMAANTPYAEWFAQQAPADPAVTPPGSPTPSTPPTGRSGA